jgi:hypothetical protein
MENLKISFFENEKIKDTINRYEESVLKGDISSFKAAGELIDIYKEQTIIN